MITPDNILKHELVGLHATVTKSTNPQLVQMSGYVIDETKFTLKLDTKNGIKTIPKNINEWRFNQAEGKDIHINGANITKRSAQRLMIKT